MGTVSIWSYLVLLAVFAVPIALVLKQAGYSRWFTILAFIPLVNLVCLWVFAFLKWPAIRKSSGDVF